MSGKTLMKTLVDAGYPRDKMYHHMSDLYVYRHIGSIDANRIVEKWYSENGLSTYNAVEQFRSATDGRLMLDCAFQYTGTDWTEV